MRNILEKPLCKCGRRITAVKRTSGDARCGVCMMGLDTEPFIMGVEQ